jgi:hypothetical protein
MAQKRITDLQLRDEVTDDLNFPSDDGIQSYRVTGLQILGYVLGAGKVATAALANLAVTAGKLAANAVETAKILDANVTYAKIQNVAANKILGNITGSAAAPAEIDFISGSYTPTLSDVDSNIDGTPSLIHARYTRIGNRVTGWIVADINPTASGSNIKCGFTLPVLPTSNFANTYDLVGIGSKAGVGTEDNSGHCFAVTGAKTGILSFPSTGTADREWRFNFEYNIA